MYKTYLELPESGHDPYLYIHLQLRRGLYS